jgi:hypothetical protein
VITQCGLSGIHSGANALIEVEGSQTKVDGNNTSGHVDYDVYGENSFGLHASSDSSVIHLLSPLTKESVSTNNHGSGFSGGWLEFGGYGKIKTVDSF